jgi:hypothetical protein
MRHKNSIEIFNYWDQIRGPHDAPLRTQMEPAAVSRALSELFILETTPSDMPRFRLAGTRICSIFGRELRGESFASLWGGSQPDDPVRIANGVMAHAVPALINATGYSISGRHLAFEVVMMPLRSSREGQGCDRLLGCMSPALNSAWLGAEPLEFLALDRSRLISEGRGGAEEPTIETRYFASRRTGRGFELAGALRRVLHWGISDSSHVQ